MFECILLAVKNGCTVNYQDYDFFELSYASVGQPTLNNHFFMEMYVPFRGFRGKTDFMPTPYILRYNLYKYQSYHDPAGVAS
jgi:hypothetical protein